MNADIGHRIRRVWAATVLVALTACGGNGAAGDGVPRAATYTIGGTVLGLSGSGLVLASNFGEELAVRTDGSFTFTTRLSTGDNYFVSVETQPTSPAQICQTGSELGRVGTANVTNIGVICETGFTVSGKVSGLVGSGLVLQIYDRYQDYYIGNPVNVTANGTFTLDSVYSANTATEEFVRVTHQPTSPTQHCVVGDAAPINIQSADITDIAVLCADFSYVANAGDNTVSTFTVAATSGKLAAVGAPVPTGTTPKAIVGTQDKKYVFVANAGSNDISAFAVDQTSGVLTEVFGSPFAAGTAPQAVALYESSGTYLYVANSGADSLSAFVVKAGTGALTPLSAAKFATGKAPSAIAVDPAGPFIYVANKGSNNLSAFSIDPSTGILTPVPGSPFAAGASPLGLAFGPSQKYLYSANTGGTNSGISGFAVNSLTGTLAALSGSPFHLPISNSIAADRTGAYLYLTNGSGVMGFSIDATTGLLVAIPGFPVAAGSNATSVTTDPTNQFLYVTDQGSDSVTGFQLDATTGGLTLITGTPFAVGPSPDFIMTL